MSDTYFEAFSSDQKLRVLREIPAKPVFMRMKAAFKNLPKLEPEYDSFWHERHYDDAAVTVYLDFCEKNKLVPMTTLVYKHGEKDVDVSLHRETDQWISDVVRHFDVREDIKERIRHGILLGNRAAKVVIGAEGGIYNCVMDNSEYGNRLLPLIETITKSGYDIEECRLCLKTFEGYYWDSGISMHNKGTTFFNGQFYHGVGKDNAEKIISFLKEIENNK